MSTGHDAFETKGGEITVGVKTFYRPRKLEACLRSLVGKHFREVIVADDGEITREKEAVYERYSGELPLRLLKLPYDSGIAYGRNQIVNACGTSYLLMLDDDQQVDSDVFRLRDILDRDQSLGGVSGFLLDRGHVSCSACDLHVQNGFLLRHLHTMPKGCSLGTLTYYVCDLIPNSTLFRFSCLRDLGWDGSYKIGREHEDFYLGHKRLGRWRFAATPDVLITHDRSGAREYKQQFRWNARRLMSSKQYFLRKWGLRGVIEGRKLKALRVPIVRKVEILMMRWDWSLAFVAWVQGIEELAMARIR